MLEFFENISLSEIRLVRFIESRLHCGLMQRQLGVDDMFWSKGMFSILDLDPQIDKPSFSLLQSLQHPEDRVSFERANANIEAAKPLSRRYRIIRRDGTMRVIHQYIEMLFSSSGKPDRSLGLILDVTDQAALENREKLLEERFLAVTRGTDLILNVLRPDGYVTGVAVGDVTHDEELNRRLGYLWQELIHPEDKEETLAVFQQAVTEKKCVAREHRIMQRNGAYRWRRSTWSPVLDDQHNLREFMSISEDIEKEKVLPVHDHSSSRITGAQIRAARALVRWSVQSLSSSSCVSPSTIRRFEEYDGPTEGNSESLRSIREALEKAGVEFIFPQVGNPGVRLA